MFSERTRRFQMLLVGLVVAALLLSLPATGFAAERGNRSGELASAGLLSRGAGYGTEAGSKAVRELQLRLRRLGDRPGPIDGLYGPVTEAAVERFQRSHGLAIDGVVGSQTKGRLLAQRAEKPPAGSTSPAQTGKPERKSPARDQRAESAPVQQPVQPSAGVGLGRADPESSSGLPPLLVALGAALVLAALLVSLRGRRRQAIEARLNLGLVCAALLAAGVLGAAVGALFATRAAPDDSDRTTADSGALLASRTDPAEASRMTQAATARTSASTGRADAAGRSRAKRARSTAGTTSTSRAQARPRPSAPAIAPHDPAASDPGPVTSVPVPAAADPGGAGPALEPPAATTPAHVPTPAPPAVPVQRPADDQSADAVTYTVRPGDALWPIARSQLAPASPVDEVARKVADLEALNQDRIESGDPDVLEAGEKLRLR